MMREAFLYVSEKVAGDSFHTFNEISKLSPRYDSSDFFFVQIGANDGKTGDPIHKFVMKYHWNGIVVEPIKSYFEMLQKTYEGNQNLIFENAAISDVHEEKKIFRMKENVKHLPKGLQGIASFHKTTLMRHNFVLPDFEKHVTEETVSCMTFKELINKHRVEKVDLLCIDTEGHEFTILKQLKTVPVRPDIIYYEHKHLSQDEKRACEKFLSDLGYVLSTKFDNTIAKRNS